MLSTLKPGISQKFKENEEIPTSQIIQTKGKFNDMYDDMTKKIADLEESLLSNQEKTSELIEKERLLKEKYDILAKQTGKWRDGSESCLFDLKAKFNQAIKSREEATDKYIKLSDQINTTSDENERLKNIFRENDILEKLENELFKEEIEKRTSENNNLEIIVKELCLKKEENYKIIENDPKIAELRKKNQNLQEMLLKKEKECEIASYKFLEADAMQKLAIRQNEIESEERRLLGDEANRLKVIVEESEKTSSLRFQRKIRECNLDELHSYEEAFNKLSQETDDLKNEFERTHQCYQRCCVEINNLSYNLQKSREKRNGVDLESDQIRGDLEEKTILLKEVENRVRDLEDKKFKLSQIKNDLNAKCQENGIVLNGLKSRISFLKEKFDFNALMNEVNLDDLNQLVNSNNSVNQTIQGVISNWEKMKTIGQPVSK